MKPYQIRDFAHWFVEEFNSICSFTSEEKDLYYIACRDELHLTLTVFYDILTPLDRKIFADVLIQELDNKYDFNKSTIEILRRFQLNGEEFGIR